MNTLRVALILTVCSAACDRSVAEALSQLEPAPIVPPDRIVMRYFEAGAAGDMGSLSEFMVDECRDSELANFEPFRIPLLGVPINVIDRDKTRVTVKEGHGADVATAEVSLVGAARYDNYTSPNGVLTIRRVDSSMTFQTSLTLRRTRRGWRLDCR